MVVWFFPGEPEFKALKNIMMADSRFMIFGRWDYRKATTETIRAFLNTFNKSEPVEFNHFCRQPVSS